MMSAQKSRRTNCNNIAQSLPHQPLNTLSNFVAWAGSGVPGPQFCLTTLVLLASAAPAHAQPGGDEAAPKQSRIVSIMRDTGRGFRQGRGLHRDALSGRGALRRSALRAGLTIEPPSGSTDDPRQVLTPDGDSWLLRAARRRTRSISMSPSRPLNGALRELDERRQLTSFMTSRASPSILMLLGATHGVLLYEARGRERLAQAITLDPSVGPDPPIFDPSMRTIFESAQATVDEARQGLKIRSGAQTTRATARSTWTASSWASRRSPWTATLEGPPLTCAS